MVCRSALLALVLSVAAGLSQAVQIAFVNVFPDENNDVILDYYPSIMNPTGFQPPPIPYKGVVYVDWRYDTVYYQFTRSLTSGTYVSALFTSRLMTTSNQNVIALIGGSPNVGQASTTIGQYGLDSDKIRVYFAHKASGQGQVTVYIDGTAAGSIILHQSLFRDFSKKELNQYPGGVPVEFRSAGSLLAAGTFDFAATTCKGAATNVMLIGSGALLEAFQVNCDSCDPDAAFSARLSGITWLAVVVMSLFTVVQYSF